MGLGLIRCKDKKIMPLSRALACIRFPCYLTVRTHTHLKVQHLSYGEVSDSEVMVHVNQVCKLVFIQDISCVSWKREPQAQLS